MSPELQKYYESHLTIDKATSTANIAVKTMVEA
jgi:hypothetical protein